MEAVMTQQDYLLDYKEAMEYLDMSNNILRRYITTGELKGSKFAGKWHFRKSWLDAFIELKSNVN